MLSKRFRIRQCIEQLRGYGVDDKFIFKLEDVLDKKRPQKVVRCLEEVSKLVRLFDRLFK
jgi:hypothetical protein